MYDEEMGTATASTVKGRTKIISNDDDDDEEIVNDTKFTITAWNVSH